MITPGTYTITGAFLVASNLVTGVAAALAAQSPGGAVSRQLVVPGAQVAWDNCDCGQLALAVPHTYTSRNFPNDFSLQKDGNCSNLYVIADMSMSIVRCVPGPTEDGEAPSVVDMMVAAAVALEDRYVLRQTVQCLLQRYYETPAVAGIRIAEWLVGDDVALGPQGNCAGSELHFKVGWWAECGCGD